MTLILAIDEQPGMPKTYKVIVDGIIVMETRRINTALIELAGEIDLKIGASRPGDS